MANGQTSRRMAHNVPRGVRTKKRGCADGSVVQNLHRQDAIHFCKSHNKESLNNLCTRDDKEVAASLASLGNSVNNERGLANMSRTVDNEHAICMMAKCLFDTTNNWLKELALITMDQCYLR